MNVWMVVAGNGAIVEVNPGTTLRALCELTLDQTDSGDGFTEWELRNAKGALLDLDTSVRSLGLNWYDRLFLNHRAGTGA